MASDTRVRLDLNDPAFQEQLLGLEKTQRHSAMETLKKISQMTWGQIYRDNGLKWERILSVRAPAGLDATYSLRISQSRRAIACRDGDFMRFLSVAPDHDATYGKK